MEHENRLKEAASGSSSSTHCGTTPKRNVIRHFGTPLPEIKGRADVNENNENVTPCPNNPFDVKAESLYFPSCSPSVFATFSRNKANNGTFRWSIEHLSFLYPADIDETSMPDSWMDPEQEKKAQQAIDAFFSQNSIVPSPWSSDSSQEIGKFKLRRMTQRSNIGLESSDNNVATQTQLSIPPDVDITKLLGNYFISDDDERSCSYSSRSCSSRENSCRETDILSNSSLRRKLFPQDAYYSPPRIGRKDLLMVKQLSTPNVHIKSVQSTPSDVLSSSPISPPNSSDCNIRPVSSPAVSPIAPLVSHSGKRLQSFSERLNKAVDSQSFDKQCDQSMYTAPDDSENFYMQSQEVIAFPSYGSEKQDTGYVTENMSSLQSMTTSENTCGLSSKVVCITEHGEDWNMSHSVSNDMSYMNECQSTDNALSECIKSTESHSKPWMPNFCSTPTKLKYL